QNNLCAQLRSFSVHTPTAGWPAWLQHLTRTSLQGERPSRAHALAVLREVPSAGQSFAGAGDSAESGYAELLDLVAAAGQVRRHFFGRRVKLNYLVNMKSGLCAEDCSYCSQRQGKKTGALTYNWLDQERALAEARAAASRGARRVCLVASGRGPSDKDIDRVAGTVGAIRDELPGVEICVCLGLLGEGQGERLAEAGADIYNHNLNTAPERYGEICTTHTFEDRAQTLKRATQAGLSPCSGVIIGMGEHDEDLVDVAMALRDLGSRSVPVNFLMPFPGTPMEGRDELTPERCLRALALFRFVLPDAEVRMAGGREIHLRSLQPLGLHIANSMFLGDYLTSEGAPGSSDLQMLFDAGFVVEGPDGETLDAQAMQAKASPVPVLRRRGPGTELPANV
ncbi:MAG TPA: biotin synthase BioB, partial [Acidimicrobiales bacterium]|nr:biotin synthase BioB [Acidimicrobiales bacterium]